MLDSELKTAIEAAKEAGRILRSMSGKAAIGYKGEVNLVTEADRASEKSIISLIRKRFPGDEILAEETGSHKTGSKRKWLIDPLDGTTNYAHGFPFWAISIALEIEGKVVLGIVYDPSRDELFTARKGEGAFLNERRISVSQEKELGKSLLTTGFPYNIRETTNDNLDNFARFCKKARAVRRPGSVALDLSYLACGRFDGYWELSISPWDVAAGILILEEAGGMVSDFSGKKLDIYKEKDILATNGKIHNQMMEVLKQPNSQAWHS